MMMDVPGPDIDGVREWVDSYTDERLSEFHINKDRTGGPRLTFVSGEYPAFVRFIKDVRVGLYENGFIISRAQKDKLIRSDADDNRTKRHVINAIPVMWVVAYANGYVCKRGACRSIRQAGSPFCESCGDIGFMEYLDVDKDDVRWLAP